MGDHSKSNPKFVSELLGLQRSAHLTQQLPPVCPSSRNDSQRIATLRRLQVYWHADSMQLRVLSLGFLQDRNIGVGVFPEREEIFVGGERPDAGRIGIRSLRGSRLQSVRASHAKTRYCTRPAVPDNAAVIEGFLKLGGGGAALSGGQVCLSAYI